MRRPCTLAVLVLLAACARAATSRDPAPDPASGPAEGPDDVAASGTGGDDPGAAAPPVCDAAGPYAPAPEGTPFCASDAVCDADEDCAHLPGTYCELDLCVFFGCLRGGCLLTKVQGQPCARDGECFSRACMDGACGPGEGGGVFRFP